MCLLKPFLPGQHNIHLPDLHEEVRRVKVGVLHPNYTWNDKEFDIGLVKLASPLRFTDYIQVYRLYTIYRYTRYTDYIYCIYVYRLCSLR